VLRRLRVGWFSQHSGLSTQDCLSAIPSARLRLTLFTLALAIRLAAIFVSGPATIRFGDGIDYIDTAKALCATHAYPSTGSLPFFRAPGLPFFIVAVTGGHPERVVMIKVALALCDALTVVLIATLFPLVVPRNPAIPSAARDLKPSPSRQRSLAALGMTGWGRGWLAGLLAAINPFFIAAVCDVRSEPLFMLLMTAAIALLLRNRSAASGVTLALAALTRPAALVCIPLFALFRPRRALPLLLGAALALAPWTLRNAVRFHELIVVNDAAGFNLWRGYAPEIMNIDRMHDPAAIARASWELDARRVAQAKTQIEPAVASPGTRSAAWRRAAFAEIAADPAAAVRWTLRKAWLYWRPWLNVDQYGFAAVAASGAWNLALYVAAIVALVRCRDRRLVIAIVVYLAVVWLAHLPYQVVMRFRQPFTDPLLIALCTGCAGVGRRDRSGEPEAA
jgi:hypothetical protein